MLLAGVEEVPVWHSHLKEQKYYELRAKNSSVCHIAWEQGKQQVACYQ
jgi:hypothetical protein